MEVFIMEIPDNMACITTTLFMVLLCLSGAKKPSRKEYF